MANDMANDKSGWVEITPPRLGTKDDQNCFIGVNGKSYLLPRGVKSKVPPEFAAEFYRAQEAESIQYQNAEKLREELGKGM